MPRNTTYLLGCGTLFSALAIGYVMQFGFGAPFPAAPTPDREMVVTGITPTSSTGLPSMPADRAALPTLPETSVTLAKAESPASATGPLPQDSVAGGFDCDVRFDATPAAGAMIRISLSAPCQGSERVTLHHHGLMFTDVTAPDGTLELDIPALTETALVIASFDNGDGAVAQTQVTSLPFYDRAAVQWKGDSGLQLHAREFSADYFSEGHVWKASAGNITRTALGQGGFLTSLGRGDGPDTLRAEVYSYPAGTTRQSGQIAITVEAEITAANCDRDIEAQTLQRRGDADLRVHDLTLSMPDCDTVGDFLVLKNLLQDLTIASN